MHKRDHTMYTMLNNIKMKSLRGQTRVWDQKRVFYKMINFVQKQVFEKKMTIFGYLKMDSFFEIEIYLKMFDNEMVYWFKCEFEWERVQYKCEKCAHSKRYESYHFYIADWPLRILNSTLKSCQSLLKFFIKFLPKFQKSNSSSTEKKWSKPDLNPFLTAFSCENTSTRYKL